MRNTPKEQIRKARIVYKNVLTALHEASSDLVVPLSKFIDDKKRIRIIKNRRI